MRLYRLYNDKNDLLNHSLMKLSKKIAVLLFVITALFLARMDYSEAAPNEEMDDLLYALSSNNKDVRAGAAEEIGNIGDPAALKALDDLWNEEMDDEVIFTIELAICKLQLSDVDPKVRILGAEGLGEKAGTRSVVGTTTSDGEGSSLFKHISVSDREMMVVIALMEKMLAVEEESNIKSAISLAIEKFKMSDGDPNTRIEAARFFAELKDPGNLMYLARVIEKEKNVNVIAALKDAVVEMEQKEQMALTLKQLFNGFAVSSQYLLIAIGLAITFGVMGVINLAHGEFMMLGCYVALMVQSLFASFFSESIFGLYFVLALPVSFMFTAALGYALERSVIRFLYGRALDTLLATWGVSLIIQQIVRNVFGANNIDVPSPGWLQGGITVFAGLHLPYKRLFIIGFTALIIGAVYWLFYRTRFGLKVRAVMQNRDMSNCLGISVPKVNSYTFALGSGLAGLAGCCMSLLGSVGPTTGQNYIVDCFMVVVLGGVGKIIGTVAGAFGLGETNAILEFFTTANVGKALAFIMVIIFLRFRPTGFSAQKGREDVRLDTH